MFKKEINNQEIAQLKRDTNRELSSDEMDQLIQDIYLSIESELRDSAYYRALADIAPNQFSEEMLMEFSKDEREHAYELQQAYEALTGKTYYPPGEMNFEIGNYTEALEKRVLDESADLKKYKGYYLMTNNQTLRDIFFNAMHDEAYHAIRELYLLHIAMTG